MNRYLLGMRVDAISYPDLSEKAIAWIGEKSGRSIFAANTHMVMEAYDNPAFRKVVNSADLVTPDGMPLVWWLRSMGVKNQPRVYGPDVMLHLCDFAAKQGLSVGLLGSTSEVLGPLITQLSVKFQGLKVGYSFCPPFSGISEMDDMDLQREIKTSGVRILFVSLGCPKQEKWIAAHRESIPAVMVGVGAAFPLLAGKLDQSPPWMQQVGLEWLFRLTREPGRLWKRYLYTIPRFTILVILESLGIIHAR
jgi:N-acetylglucosaminyldiphosphoundecaprenol N-acetyl-beta-D-mannosaminyltransferase